MVLVSYDKEPCVIRRTLNSYRPKHYNVQKYKKTREKRKKKTQESQPLERSGHNHRHFFSFSKQAFSNLKHLLIHFVKSCARIFTSFCSHSLIIGHPFCLVATGNEMSTATLFSLTVSRSFCLHS